MSIERGAPISVPRWLTAVMALLVAGISLLAFVLSFEVLSDMAARAGIPAGIAWAWPVIVDGSIVASMLVIFVWRDRPRRTTVWPWVTLLFFAVVSIVGNGVHTAVVYDATQGITLWFAIFMGAIPPVGLLLSSEMLVRLLTPADTVVVGVATPVAGTVATVATVPPERVTPDATVSPEPDTKVTQPAAPAVISEEEPSENTGITGVVEPVATVAPLSPGRLTPDATVSPEPVTDATAAGAALDEALDDGSDATVPYGAVAATVAPVATADATSDTDVIPVATVTQLHAVEKIPDDPAGQVDWIVARAQAGHDVTREALMQVFDEAGQPVSDRTLQRRIASAREQAPELLQANA